MKKLIAVLLVLTLACSMLAGCGKKTTTDTKSETTTETKKEDTSKTEDAGSEDVEPVTVKVSYPCLVIVPSEDATQGVEDVINAHLEEIGSRIRMDLEAVDGNNYATTIDMKQIGGEDVDLYMALGNLSDHVSSSKVLPISEYRNTALQPILDITGETFLDATTYNGEVYGVPVYRTDVVTYYWVCDYEVANKELGLEEGDTYTMDQLTEALGILHEKYPEMVTMGVRPGMNGAANNFCLSAIYGGVGYYEVTTINGGVGIVGTDTTVKNLYETEYFKTVCETAYNWNQNGYVNKDASVVTEEGYDLVKAGRALSYIIGYGGLDPQVTDADDTTHGKSVIMVPITQTLDMPSSLDWCVSYGCEDPEAACEALSLFYTDPFVMNSILCGVEGRDYIDTGLGNGDDKVVKFPEGLDAFSVPYYAYFTCGIMGNEYIDWVYADENNEFEDNREARKAFQAAAKDSPIYGFKLNTENVKNQVAALSTVESEYLGGLLTGELDPEIYIPEFVAELKSVGMDDVVAEAQAQLDAWLAALK